jgi:hypothetical protein
MGHKLKKDCNTIGNQIAIVLTITLEYARLEPNQVVVVFVVGKGHVV